ncbi:MAG: triose-phosphate isomerase [Candidatus Gottesmanbacteria bacterium]|nr:triose-phosphate isomerase [Candidatus Gottesmanbacteria bacterium]
MGTILIAGNWKSNKTILEAKQWLQEWNIQLSNNPIIQWKNVTVVLCVPFTLLYPLKKEIDRLKLPIELGAQDVSPYPDGAYTGEVSARQIKEFASWVIIGHSERRNYFGETDEILSQKVTQAKSVGLSILYCVPDDVTVVPVGVDAVAYEPVWAIGTGKSDTPQNAGQVIQSIKAKTHTPRVIYGGSVTSENVATFIAQPAVDGVLPGGASMDPVKFANLIKNLCNPK